MNPGEFFNFDTEMSSDVVVRNSISTGPAATPSSNAIGFFAAPEVAIRPAPPQAPTLAPQPTANGGGQGPARPQDPIYRSIDGTGNNLAHGDMNAAGADFVRLGPAHFADGVDSMFTNLPNARDISNIVVAGHGDDANAEGLSGMMYAWGQFLDHDLDLAKTDGKTHIDISISPGDPDLSASKISMTRTVIDPATGLNGKAATAVNSVTGWLDGSQVYGSDAATAASLRTADGHMLTSAGNNLPVVNGAFVAGDARVQENPDLTALQTLFVREHNYQVDHLKALHPDWTGDHLYEQAKAIVTAEIAHITYSEFLPHLIGPNAVSAYTGYDPKVNATISEEFAGAAFRFGHSIVSANLQKVGEQGQDVGPAVSLKDAFFQSTADFEAYGGADGLLRHLSGDLSNALDVHIVDDLRNFLDVPPVAMDLAAINIQRGRDLGLGSLNETRIALHLKPYASFSELTSDPTTAAALKNAYGSIDKVDLWVGGLAENHQPGAMMGQTFQVIIGDQFEALRDGDRFWYQNQGFDGQTLSQIQHTSLSDIILRNTDTQHIQADAFVYYDRHGGLASGGEAEHPEARQLIIGSDGADTLIGGVNNDILVAGHGSQLLTGGAGKDDFQFAGSDVTARITDFQPGQDHLTFDHSSQGLKIRQVGANTVVDLGTDHITLVGVNSHQVSLNDFVFRG